jgi:hypothetical protein
MISTIIGDFSANGWISGNYWDSAQVNGEEIRRAALQYSGGLGPLQSRMSTLARHSTEK